MKATVIALSLLIATSAFADTTPAAKCQAGKQQAAGKYALCRSKAERKLTLRGDLSKYSDDLAICTTKLTERFRRLEEIASKKRSRCPTLADVVYIKNLVDVHVEYVASQLALPPFRFVDNG